MSGAKTVVDVILGEAAQGPRATRYSDMLAVASAIQNRATQGNVTAHEVISAQDRRGNKQFDAYGRSLPKGAADYRDLAQRAWSHVTRFGPTHRGTYYATLAAAKNLPAGLREVARTAGHVVFEDPHHRSFLTARGYVSPAPASTSLGQAITPANAPVPTAAPRGGSQGLGMAALTPNGMASRLPSTVSTVPTPRGVAPAAGFVSDDTARAYSYASPLGIEGVRVTSPFGGRAQPTRGASTYHRGVDMTGTDRRGQAGYPAYAVAGGTVTVAGKSGGYGNLVEVQHDDGTRSRYGHLGSINVQEGDRVGKGVAVGTVGGIPGTPGAGVSTGPHLHFEMMDQQGRQMNPAGRVDFTTPNPAPSNRATAASARGYEQAGRNLAGSGLQSVGGFPGNVAVALDEAATQAAESRMAAGNASLWSGPQAPAGYTTDLAARANDRVSQAFDAPMATPASLPALSAMPASLPSLAGPAGSAAFANAPQAGPSAREANAMSMASLRGNPAGVEAALGDRVAMNAPGTMAPASIAPAAAPPSTAPTSFDPTLAVSPARPDNFAAAGPRGMGGAGGLYVGGVPATSSAAATPAANAYAQAAATMGQAGIRNLSGLPAAQALPPTTPQNIPSLLAQPAMPAAARSFAPASPAAPSVPTGMEAISGLFGAAPGSRANASWGGGQFQTRDDGRVDFTNQYGYTRALSPEDYSHPENTSRPSSSPRAEAQERADAGGILGRVGGLLDRAGDNLQRVGDSFGPGGRGRGVMGTLGGAALGGLIGGPLGAMALGMIGKEVALNGGFGRGLNFSFGPRGQPLGRNELSSLLGTNFTPGLAFPEAPAFNSFSWGGSSPSFDQMSAISPDAASAISKGVGGLY